MRGLVESKRYLLPLAAAAGCLFAATFVSPIIAYLLIVAAFGLVLDAATAWFERAGGTGGMHDYRQ